MSEVSFPPSKTSTPSDVWGKHGRSSETPTTWAMNSPRCCHQADGTAASGPEPAERETASSCRQSDCWTPDSKTILAQPPTPNPHTEFHLHTSHTDSDSTVACLAWHRLEHTQLHLLFCTNNYCTELRSKTLTVYITVSQYKSYTYIYKSLENTGYYVYIM